MVEGFVLENVEKGTAAAGLRVHGAHDYSVDAGLNDGAGTHLAGLERNVEGAALEAPVVNKLGSLFDGGNLSVGKGGLVGVATIVAAADYLAFVDDDAADGNFAELVGLASFLQGFFHVFFIFGKNFFHTEYPLAGALSPRPIVIY